MSYYNTTEKRVIVVKAENGYIVTHLGKDGNQKTFVYKEWGNVILEIQEGLGINR